jgi:hypothetical protein
MGALGILIFGSMKRLLVDFERITEKHRDNGDLWRREQGPRHIWGIFFMPVYNIPVGYVDVLYAGVQRIAQM